MRGSRAKVGGPAKRGTTVASTWPSRPSLRDALHVRRTGPRTRRTRTPVRRGARVVDHLGVGGLAHGHAAAALGAEDVPRLGEGEQQREVDDRGQPEGHRQADVDPPPAALRNGPSISGG